MEFTPTQPSTGPDETQPEREGGSGGGASAASDVLCTLVCISGNAENIDLHTSNGAGEEPKCEWVFGRHASCDIVLGDIRRISNRHFRIWTRSQQSTDSSERPIILIEDLSTNGTFVNTQRLPKRRSSIVTQGDEIGVAIGVPADERRFILHYGPAYASSHQSAYSLSMSNTEDELRGVNAKYVIQDMLGRGAFAVVKRAVERTTGELFAVKVIPKKRIMTGVAVKREVCILTKLNHPHVVRLQECFDTEPHSIYVVMEYVGGGDLMDYVTNYGPLDEPLAKVVTRQVLQALMYVHGLGISHRDIKPDNILLSKPGKQTPETVNVKVTDFGLAKLAESGTVLRTFCGTMSYLAPEVIKTREAAKTERKSAFYSNAVDMWSVGCMVYVILTGYCPFSGATQEQLCRQIISGRYSEEPLDNCEVSAEARSFIAELLNVDATKRPSAKGALMLKWLLEDVNEPKPAVEGEVEIAEQVEKVEENEEDRMSEVDSTEIRAATARMSLGEHPHEAQTSLVGASSGSSSRKHIYGVRDYEDDSDNENSGNDNDSDKKSDKLNGETKKEEEEERLAIPPTAWVMLRTMPDSIPFKDQLLTNDVTWLGRALGCNVMLNDARVSKLHCAIRRSVITPDSGSRDGKTARLYAFYLCDFSLNGCFVNGTKITKGMQTELRDGDVVDVFKEHETKLSFKVVLRRPEEYREAERASREKVVRRPTTVVTIDMGKENVIGGGGGKRRVEEGEERPKQKIARR
ncbi:kinase-like domain-containing protein [Myxozyma melibiosi]|uniref:Serine/threonine-protein kinase RAD53 n=1 Tax=Myxozyma melibiosi TaxID=54550 RepID=A0ABR1F2Z5_9ASCO